MRQIRFRGKDLETKEWVYGFYTQGSWIDPDTDKETIRHIIDDGILHDIDPDTLGQFTGLQDKNGQDIYEWDVIAQHADGLPDIQGIVLYDEANARFVMFYTDSEGMSYVEPLTKVKCYSDDNRELTYEIIGNTTIKTN